MTDDDGDAGPGVGDPSGFDDWTDPGALLGDRPIRERLLDVVLRLREPTRVRTVAERVDYDPETARDYLEWFTEIGLVREQAGRPVRYERNESYLRWRRVDRIRMECGEREVVEALDDAVAELRAYRERFDADRPGEVSLLEAGDGDIGEVWEALSDRKTVRKRADLLEAALRDGPASGDVVGRADD